MIEPSPLIKQIPSLVPFVAPEALEQAMGVRFKLRLGANESAFGPSLRALEAVQATRLWTYGDPQAIALRSELAMTHGVTEDRILIGSGIDELLSLFCRLIVSPGDAVVTTAGSYPTFRFGAMAAFAEVRAVPYRNDQVDLAALSEAAKGARVVYLANPDNPSGSFHSASALEEFLDRCPEDVVVLLDEAYADFISPDQLLQFAEDPRVVRLRTFSKAHGLAGLRIAYAIADPSLVQSMDKIRMHFGVNGPAQAAALASLKDRDHLDAVVRGTASGREQLADLGRSLGLTTLGSSTNFLLFDFGTRERAEAMLSTLLREGVFVRKPMGSALDRCIRVSICLPDALSEFGEILTHLIQRGDVV